MLPGLNYKYIASIYIIMIITLILPVSRQPYIGDETAAPSRYTGFDAFALVGGYTQRELDYELR